MSIVVICPNCSRIANAPEEAAGKKARCGGCRKSFAVPISDRRQTPSACAISIDCPSCMETSEYPGTAGGRRVHCRSCGEKLWLPQPAENEPRAPKWLGKEPTSGLVSAPGGEVAASSSSTAIQRPQTTPTPGVKHAPRRVHATMPTTESRAAATSQAVFPSSANTRKALFFGLLGALGCLAGWLIGEPLLLLGLPDRSENAASLVSKPEAPELKIPTAPPTTAPVFTTSSTSQAPEPPPAPPFGRGSGKSVAPPPEFADRLKAAGAQSGDVQISLIWSNRNDLDIHCIDPNGERIYWRRKSSQSGGKLDVDMNVRGESTRPVENIFWPMGGAPLGKYKVYVHHYAKHGFQNTTQYKVNLLIHGKRQEFSGSVIERQMRLITEFEVKPRAQLNVAVSPTVEVEQGGENRLRVRIARMHVPGAVSCRFIGDLNGIVAPEFTIGPGEKDATPKVGAGVRTSLGTRKLTLRVSAQETVAEASFDLKVTEPAPQLRLAVSPDVVVPQGGKNQLQIRLAGVNLRVPVKLHLEGDVSGIALGSAKRATDNEIVLQDIPERTGASDATDLVVPLEMAADDAARVGPRRIKLIAAAGDVHSEVIFQVQVLEVNSALHLAVPKEIEIYAGGENVLPVRIAREKCSGQVVVRLLGDDVGLSPKEFTIAADQNEYELTLLASKEARIGMHKFQVSAGSAGVSTAGSLHVKITQPQNGTAWSWGLVFLLGMWTAILALGLSVSLVMGQNWYLARPLLSPREFGVLAGGSLIAGFVAGGVGQTLYGVFTQVGVVPEIGFLFGWLLLGGLLGRGVVLFIPNLNAWRAAGAGSCGGLLGALVFLGVSAIGDVAGRFMGAAILGFALGLMVALVEAACRRIWLEVHDRSGKRERRVVNLGNTPVFIGGDPNKCTVMVAGAPVKALKFWENDGQVFCLDVVAEKTFPVAPGYRHPIKDSEVVVCAAR